MTITLHPRQIIGLLLIVAAIYWHLHGPELGPLLPNSKVTAAVYVYDVRTSGGVPSGVLAGLNRVNREKGIVATAYEHTEGNTVPKQYAVPLEEAKKAGLPALVVMAGETATKVVKGPTTAEQVLEAIE